MMSAEDIVQPLTVKELIEHLRNSMAKGECTPDTPIVLGDDEELNGLHDAYEVCLGNKNDQISMELRLNGKTDKNGNFVIIC